jgi:hypothetical protein
MYFSNEIRELPQFGLVEAVDLKLSKADRTAHQVDDRTIQAEAISR